MPYAISQLQINLQRDTARLGTTKEETKFLIDTWEARKIIKENYHHTDGAHHNRLFVFTYNSYLKLLGFEMPTWGLVPNDVRDAEEARIIRNFTIVAYGEIIFTHPIFAHAVTRHRCIIPLNGFFEHHRSNNQEIPFYVKRKDGLSLFVGGIMSIYEDPETNNLIPTFSIVNTRANPYFLHLYNDPIFPDLRMPLILNDEDARTWLRGTPHEAKKLIKPNSDIELEAWTVGPLHGEDYVGNVKEVQEPFHYDFVDPGIFE